MTVHYDVGTVKRARPACGADQRRGIVHEHEFACTQRVQQVTCKRCSRSRPFRFRVSELLNAYGSGG